MTDSHTSEALAGRLLTALTGAAELMTIELGRELGLYDALRGQNLTAADLAKSAGIDQRYAREWLEQQAAAGILTVATPSPDGDARSFTLTEPAAAN